MPQFKQAGRKLFWMLSKKFLSKLKTIPKFCKIHKFAGGR